MLPPPVIWYVVTSAWKEHAATCEPSTEKNGSDVGKETKTGSVTGQTRDRGFEKWQSCRQMECENVEGEKGGYESVNVHRNEIN
jgi:hypothetical protein